MAKEANGNNILGAQLVQASVLAGRLTIETGCWLPSKLRTTIFDFYCGGFSNFSPYSIFSDSSNGPQEWSNFSGVKVSLFWLS